MSAFTCKCTKQCFLVACTQYYSSTVHVSVVQTMYVTSACWPVAGKFYVGQVKFAVGLIDSKYKCTSVGALGR